MGPSNPPYPSFLETVLSNLKADYDRTIEARLAALEAELNSTLESHIAQLEAEHDHKLAELKSTVEARMADIQVELDARASTVGGEIVTLKHRLTTFEMNTNAAHIFTYESIDFIMGYLIGIAALDDGLTEYQQSEDPAPPPLRGP
jgi:hypothetical protein